MRIDGRVGALRRGDRSLGTGATGRYPRDLKIARVVLSGRADTAGHPYLEHGLCLIRARFGGAPMAFRNSPRDIQSQTKTTVSTMSLLTLSAPERFKELLHDRWLYEVPAIPDFETNFSLVSSWPRPALVTGWAYWIMRRLADVGNASFKEAMLLIKAVRLHFGARMRVEIVTCKRPRLHILC